MAPLLMITDSIILSACHFSRPSIILSIIGDGCLTGDRCLLTIFIIVAPGNSGSPGALQEVLTGPHPAVSGPLPATRQQRLARLAEEGYWVPTHWWGFHLPRW